MEILRTWTDLVSRRRNRATTLRYRVYRDPDDYQIAYLEVYDVEADEWLGKAMLDRPGELNDDGFERAVHRIIGNRF